MRDCAVAARRRWPPQPSGQGLGRGHAPLQVGRAPPWRLPRTAVAAALHIPGLHTQHAARAREHEPRSCRATLPQLSVGRGAVAPCAGAGAEAQPETARAKGRTRNSCRTWRGRWPRCAPLRALPGRGLPPEGPASILSPEPGGEKILKGEKISSKNKRQKIPTGQPSFANLRFSNFRSPGEEQREE